MNEIKRHSLPSACRVQESETPRRCGLGLAALMSLSATMLARTQDAEDFCMGKAIALIVASTPDSLPETKPNIVTRYPGALGNMFQELMRR